MQKLFITVIQMRDEYSPKNQKKTSVETVVNKNLWIHVWSQKLGRAKKAIMGNKWHTGTEISKAHQGCLFAQGLSLFECLLSYTHQDDAGEQRDWKTMLLWKGSVVSGKLSNQLSQIKWDLPSNRLSEMVWTISEYVMIWINESVNFEGPLKQFGKVCNCAEALCYNCTSGTFYGI